MDRLSHTGRGAREMGLGVGAGCGEVEVVVRREELVEALVLVLAQKCFGNLLDMYVLLIDGCGQLLRTEF